MKKAFSILFCLHLVLVCSSLSAGIISGNSTGYASTSGDWLTNTANDIDGNGLGTDGWHFFGNFDGIQGGGQPLTTFVQSLPSYVSNVTPGTDAINVADEFSSYGSIDDPLILDGTDGTAGTLISAAGSDALSFTIPALTPGNAVVRVGVLSQIEGNNDGRWDPTSISLSDGTTTVTASGLSTGAPNVGWVFFDIDMPGTYTLGGTRRFNRQGIGIGGLTFDSVPEPSTLTIFGVGALGILFRRRRK